MSDFDKEAEREKLREKYADEAQDRETTQRMSDLLLQGATMTNRHCNACGDPVFRYEGQEFCPSCQAAGGEGAGSQPRQLESASVETEADANESELQQLADDTRTDPVDTGSQPSEIRERGAESEPDPASSQSVGASQSAVGASPPSASGGLSGAREELTRSIATLARRASAAEDPRRAREFLEAADEAATTLATLDGR